MHSSGTRPENDGASRLSLNRTSLTDFWKRRASKIGFLLSAFAYRQGFGRQPGSGNSPLPPTNEAFGQQSHLQRCYERAIDAYTVEDAIFWHSEVINELSVEIYALTAKPGESSLRRQMIADLTTLQSRHGVILHRLTGILARNEQFIWKPRSADHG